MRAINAAVRPNFDPVLLAGSHGDHQPGSDARGAAQGPLPRPDAQDVGRDRLLPDDCEMVAKGAIQQGVTCVVPPGTFDRQTTAWRVARSRLIFGDTLRLDDAGAAVARIGAADMGRDSEGLNASAHVLAVLLAMTLDVDAAVSGGIHAWSALRRTVLARRFEECLGSGATGVGPRLTTPIRPNAR